MSDNIGNLNSNSNYDLLQSLNEVNKSNKSQGSSLPENDSIVFDIAVATTSNLFDKASQLMDKSDQLDQMNSFIGLSNTSASPTNSDVNNPTSNDINNEINSGTSFNESDDASAQELNNMNDQLDDIQSDINSLVTSGGLTVADLAEIISQLDQMKKELEELENTVDQTINQNQNDVSMAAVTSLSQQSTDDMTKAENAVDDADAKKADGMSDYNQAQTWQAAGDAAGSDGDAHAEKASEYQAEADADNAKSSDYNKDAQKEAEKAAKHIYNPVTYYDDLGKSASDGTEALYYHDKASDEQNLADNEKQDAEDDYATQTADYSSAGYYKNQGDAEFQAADEDLADAANYYSDSESALASIDSILATMGKNSEKNDIDKALGAIESVIDLLNKVMAGATESDSSSDTSSTADSSTVNGDQKVQIDQDDLDTLNKDLNDAEEDLKEAAIEASMVNELTQEAAQHTSEASSWKNEAFNMSMAAHNVSGNSMEENEAAFDSGENAIEGGNLPPSHTLSSSAASLAALLEDVESSSNSLFNKADDAYEQAINNEMDPDKASNMCYSSAQTLDQMAGSLVEAMQQLLQGSQG